jgi:hypothetical protein
VADARFGRIVLQTRTNEAYTLDLYEAEGRLVCRGFYLPPPPPLGSPLPAEIPSEVEFVAPADVWDLLQESLRPFGVSDELRHYTLADPGVSNYRFYVDMAAAPAAERREAEVWSGHVRAGLGEFTFVLEQYRSPEIAAVLIIICILLFSDQHASEHAAECYRRAAETCGEGRIRSVHVARRLTGTTLRVETECQFECAEHGSSG